MSNYPNEFRRTFAIRMPNGSLYGEAPVVENAVDYSQNSAQRDYQQMMDVALGIRRAPPKPAVAGPTIYNTRRAAEAMLAELQKQAASVGVDVWGGTVVESLSTPFTSGDPSIDFADAILAWMRDGQS